MRKNILLSTTRQWNPGDEFILHGCVHILNQLFGDQINPIIYNRNPDIRSGGSKLNNCYKTVEKTYHWDTLSFKGKGLIGEYLKIGQYDNSWKDNMNCHNIDFAIFAGSPEWYGRRLRQMYKTIEQGKIPTAFLGLGAGDSVDFKRSDPSVYRVLSQAKIITTRDMATESLLQNYGAVYIPCPALLAANRNRQVKSVKKIGLIYATDKTLKGNNVSRQMHEYILKLYSDLAKRYPVGLVCHYIDEIDQAREEFPYLDIYYSYDSKDYEEIYDHFDLVLGGRVHGIGMSASLGIPGIMIKHDARSSTTDGFLASSVLVGTELQQVIAEIEKAMETIETRSGKLIEHKKNVMEQYVSLFHEKYADLF